MEKALSRYLEFVENRTIIKGPSPSYTVYIRTTEQIIGYLSCPRYSEYIYTPENVEWLNKDMLFEIGRFLVKLTKKIK